MELAQLKYFKAVAEIGKISSAAESLFISAPALSTSISRLEKELGMQLFDRSNNRITLNKQGQIFLRYVNQIFNNLDCARAELRQSLLHQERLISVATMNSNLWIDLLTAFSQEHPQFTLSCANVRRDQLISGGLPHQHSFLLAGEEDTGPAMQEETDKLLLFEDNLAIIVHPDHPFASLDSITLEDLVGNTVFLPLEGNPLFERIRLAFEQRSLPLPSGKTYSYMVYRHMTQEGMGIAFTTLQSAGVERKSLRCIPIKNAGKSWRMYLYWRKRRPLTADEELFRDFVKHFYYLH